jgi:hypothetical protein
MFAEAGLEAVEHRVTPIPWENVLPPGLPSAVSNAAERLDFLLARLDPNLFAYQHLFELKPTSTR